MLVPLRDNEFKMVGVLRGLTLVDSAFSQVKNTEKNYILANDHKDAFIASMNHAPRKVRFNLKRTLGYGEGEGEPPATRARIDDENLQEEVIETGTGDVTREHSTGEMETD
jgi:hypothetical protein